MHVAIGDFIGQGDIQNVFPIRLPEVVGRTLGLAAHADHDAVATDVLSFDLRDMQNPACPRTALDCELVVNAERALEAASERSLEPLAELNLYVVHGLLHQLGYDDKNAQQERLMHQKEDQLLDELGWGQVFWGTKGL